VDAAGPWTEFAAGIAAYGERGGTGVPPSGGRARIAAVGAGPRSAYEVVELDVRPHARTSARGGTPVCRTRVIGAAHDDAVDPAYYPEPRVRTFTGPGGREVHAHVHPPHHPGCVAPAGELPPYVVWAHGGPTSRSPLVLDLEIAY
ncbi:S9 family peptidase, partial [Streptomyces sp. TRM76130]|nr:S9 family peptidase [Streptomyces sp. TRM76130]